MDIDPVPVGVWPSSTGGQEEMGAARAYRNKSAAYWFSVTEEANIECKWKVLAQGAIPEKRKRILHITMLDILQPLCACTVIELFVSVEGRKECMCSSVLKSYFFDILEGRTRQT